MEYYIKCRKCNRELFPPIPAGNQLDAEYQFQQKITQPAIDAHWRASHSPTEAVPSVSEVPSMAEIKDRNY